MAVQVNLEDYVKPWKPGIYPKSTTVIYNNQLWILNDTITGLFTSSDFLAEVANGDWIGRYTTEDEFADVAYSGDYNDLINIPPLSTGEQNIEVITLQNRWTLTNANTYYRSRGDYAGFNDAVITITTGQSSYATLNQTQRSSSSFFYYVNGAKKLHKIIVDCGNIASTITSYTLMVVACQRVESNNVATSTINGINLGEYTMTKINGNVSNFSILTPIDVTIPDGYIVTCFLKRADGTAEINCSIMFQFKNA